MRYISLKESNVNVGILKSTTDRDEQNHSAENWSHIEDKCENKYNQLKRERLYPKQQLQI